MPKVIWPLQSECLAFYGDPTKGDWYTRNTIAVTCPWKLKIAELITDHIHIHRKCAESLARVFNVIWNKVGKDAKKIEQLHYDIFDGSYNLRAMRGGNTLSMHSFAAAIDFDAEHNPWRNKVHLFKKDSLIVVAFNDEGWVWGGDWSAPDAMHFQAARVHA